jgi:alcohol dehydrogenase
MRALVLEAGGPAVRDVPVPAMHGEALVRVRLAGVCATDLELVKGYMGFAGTLGHEWVGDVVSAPDGAWVGKRVVGDINAACRSCPTCLAGRPTHCPNRTVLGIQGRDGAFAEHLSLPMANLHLVPAGVPDEAAVFVEPLAAACEILEQIHVRPSQRLAVLGTGRLGQLCARVLALTGAETWGIGRNERTLALLPASVRAASLAEVTGDGFRGGGFDVVVDTTGSSAGLALAGSLVRPRGTIVLKTTVHDIGEARPTGWVIDEVTLVGSRCGPFEPALRLLASGLVDPRPLVSARFALTDGVKALRRAAEPGTVKVLLQPT